MYIYIYIYIYCISRARGLTPLCRFAFFSTGGAGSGLIATGRPVHS